jgi:hypothetical protein
MSTARNVRTRPWPPQRWARWGFVVGVAITVPATFFALLSHTGEALHPYLVSGTELLGPLSDTMATWPGLMNMVSSPPWSTVSFTQSAPVPSESSWPC